jgi:hypothetical protein
VHPFCGGHICAKTSDALPAVKTSPIKAVAIILFIFFILSSKMFHKFICEFLGRTEDEWTNQNRKHQSILMFLIELLPCFAI